jgi:O-antigen biosynthesis protein
MKKFLERLELFSRNKALAPSPAHQVAHGYWQKCSNSFLANPEYYDRCEVVLNQHLLQKLERPSRTLDAGCGSGRFTLPLARVSLRLDAFDLSPTLIEEAKANARKQGLDNIRFWVDNVVAPKSRLKTYELVSCMGVISTIIDEWAFLQVRDVLTEAVKPGGLLLLRDSVSLLPEGRLVDTSDYATRYRNRDEYRRAFQSVGFQLDLEITLAEFGTSVNAFFLFRAPLQS